MVRKQKCFNKGFVLIEVLLGLLVLLVVTLLGSMVVQILSYVRFNADLIQNDIGVIQLRNYLNQAYEISVEGDELNYLIRGKEYRLRLLNNRLIQQPGTLIFLVALDDAHFHQIDDEIFLIYRCNNQEREVIITYER